MKPGESVRLKNGEGTFIDFQTGFEVSGNRSAKLEKPIGKATAAAIAAGGLVAAKPAAAPVKDAKPAKESKPAVEAGAKE